MTPAEIAEAMDADARELLASAVESLPDGWSAWSDPYMLDTAIDGTTVWSVTVVSESGDEPLDVQVRVSEPNPESSEVEVSFHASGISGHDCGIPSVPPVTAMAGDAGSVEDAFADLYAAAVPAMRSLGN